MIKPFNKIIKIFNKHKLWDDQIELVGSWCFYLYQKYLGVKKFPLKTQDIDILINIPYKRKKQINLLNDFKEIGFVEDFKNDGTIFITNGEFKIEFLVPKRGPGTEEIVKIKPLSITAVSLRHLDMLFEEPIILIENNIRIKLPNPTQFILHKLLISSRRRIQEKKIKDIQQAIYTYPIIDGENLKKEFSKLSKNAKQKIMKNLKYAIEKIPLEDKIISNIIFTLQ
ncbi:MAG: nucleotidyltransferase domain-containing protein [Spirochaetes bacterium]|nr:nucleotidyltransferase domain-containing protein [Spirochaetota bacterium]